jgi:hypothetical protein
MKWLRIGALVVALVVAIPILFMFSEMGIIGLILFFIIYSPILLIFLVIVMGIGALIGAIVSGKKQAQSLRETAASGSAELHQLDKERVKLQGINGLLMVLSSIATGITVIVGFGSGINLNGEPLVNPATVAILGVVTLVLWVFKFMMDGKNKQFNQSFKEQVVRPALQSFLTNLEFTPDKSLPEVHIKDSSLFGDYTVYRGNDYIAAEYNGRKFIQSDVNLVQQKEIRTVDKDGTEHTRIEEITVFSGRLMVFDYDAISNEAVRVLDRARNRKASREIQMELDSFNRRYVVDAENPTAAFRILTPPVLEGIMKATDFLKRPVSLAFVNDKIYVYISSRDSFEAVVEGDETLIRQQERVREDIQAALDMVDNIYQKDRREA